MRLLEPLMEIQNIPFISSLDVVPFRGVLCVLMMALTYWQTVLRDADENERLGGIQIGETILSIETRIHFETLRESTSDSWSKSEVTKKAKLALVQFGKV